VRYIPAPEELSALKVRADSTLRELRFTDEAIDNARPLAAPEAAPYMEGVTLDTRIGELGFFKGTGCELCAGTGLKGRQGVYEVMSMTPLLRRLIVQNAGAAELKDAAVGEGMLTLRMDAWLKVMKGITTTEQVIRETSA
jgi:type IV pilus assembly protein PilB